MRHRTTKQNADLTAALDDPNLLPKEREAIEKLLAATLALIAEDTDKQEADND